MSKILIIEDDASIQMGIKTFLESEGLEVFTAGDGEEGVNSALENRPDLITLDLMLPKMNGYDVCKELRSKGIKTPIIMLTAKTDELDKILGLEIGADDYMTKPFSIRELHARIRAQLRRLEMTTVSDTGDSYEFSDIAIVWKKREVKKSGEIIDMSVKEFQVLKYLVEHAEEVVTREMLLDDVWGYDSFPTTRTVDNYILNLRKKIEDDASKPKHITTVHTLGYKFLK